MFDPKKLYSLQPDDLDKSGLVTKGGTPFYLSRTQPKATKPAPKQDPDKQLKAMAELASVTYSPGEQAQDYQGGLEAILNPLAAKPYYSDLTDADGTPFYLAKKKPTMVETKVAPTNRPMLGVSPAITEELIRVRKAPKSPVTVKQPTADTMPGPVADVLPVEAPIAAEPTHPAPEAEILSQYYELMNKRMGRTSELEADYNKLKGEKPQGWSTYDMTPLMGWVDDTYGGNAAKHYKAPTAVKDWEGKLKDAQALMLGNEDKLAGDQFNQVHLTASRDQFKELQGQENFRQDRDLANRLEVARINAAAKEHQARNDALGWARLGFDINKDKRGDVRKLQDDITPATGLISAIEEAASLVERYPNMPGVGMDKYNPLHLRDADKEDGGATARALSRVNSLYANFISGKTVTDKEKADLRAQIGDTVTGDVNSVRNSLQYLSKAAQRNIDQVQTGYDPSVVGIYKGHGGLTKVQSGASFPKTVRKNGQTASVSNQAELAEAMAEGWK